MGKVASPGFNFIVAIMAIVVNWFIILGILYFCILLIERYIIALFLVLLSPLAVLGFFASITGGNTLTSKFSGLYKSWSERLGYVFVMPVVLIFGFSLVLVIFRSALGNAISPENFVTLLGIDNPEGRQALLQLITGSIVLILGIFQVGKAAKSAGLHPAIAKRFNFGEQMTKFFGPKTGWGLLKSAGRAGGGLVGKGVQRAVGNRLASQVEKWSQSDSKIAKKIAGAPGIGKPLDLGGKVRRGKRVAESLGAGLESLSKGKSVQDIEWRSAENLEERRVEDILRDGSHSDKVILLKQVLDPKSDVTLTKEQSAQLAQTSVDFHPYMAGLKEGISVRTRQQMYDRARKDAEEIAEKGGTEAIEEEMEEVRNEIDRIKKEAGKTYGQQIKNAKRKLGQVEESVNSELDEQVKGRGDVLRQANTERAEMEKRVSGADEALKMPGRWLNCSPELENHEKRLDDLRNSNGPRYEILGAEKSVRAAQVSIDKFRNDKDPQGIDSAQADLDAAEADRAARIDGVNGRIKSVEAEIEKLRNDKSSGIIAKDRKRDLEGEVKRLKNEKKAYGKQKLDSSEEKLAVLEKEWSQVAEAKTRSGVTIASTAGTPGAGTALIQKALDDLDPKEVERITQERKDMTTIEGDSGHMLQHFITIGKMKKEDLKEEKSPILDEIGDLEDELKKVREAEQTAANNFRITQLTEEIAARKKSVADIESKSMEIKDIQKSLGSQDLSDFEKLGTLRESADYINRYVSDLSDEQKSHVEGLVSAVEEISSSLDEQERILNGPEYKEVLQREKKSRSLSADTLLKDIKKRMDNYKTTYQKRNKQKPSSKKHEQQDEWKTLDVWRKAVEAVIKQGGASSKKSADARKEEEKRQKQASQRQKQASQKK